MISLICAVGTNGVIGKDNQMLWHLPNDFAFFKKHTLGKTIFMGRKTWDSLPIKPLPGRRNLVLSRQSLDLPLNTECVDNFSCLDSEEDVMIIGGAQIYEATIDIANYLYLTHVDINIDGDAYFPNWNKDEWVLETHEKHNADARHGYDYTFEVYSRK